MSTIRFADVYNEIYTTHSITFSSELGATVTDRRPIVELTARGDLVFGREVTFLGHVKENALLWLHAPPSPSERYALWRKRKLSNADPEQVAAIRRLAVLRSLQELLFVCKHADPRATCRALIEQWGLRKCRGSIEWTHRLGTKIPLPLKKALRTLERAERRKDGVASRAIR